jgi:hypothetical protein
MPLLQNTLQMSDMSPLLIIKPFFIALLFSRKWCQLSMKGHLDMGQTARYGHKPHNKKSTQNQWQSQA